MHFLICVIIFFASVVAPASAADREKCPTSIRLDARLKSALAGMSVTAIPGPARVAEPVTLAWSVGSSGQKFDSATRAYLIVLLPDAVRVDGAGFFALAAGSPNPHGVQFGIDRTRAIVPLHSAFASTSGQIQVLPFAAVPLNLQWALVVTDGCNEQVIRRNEIDPIAVSPGAPRLAARDEFSVQRPDKVIKPLEGPYELRVFANEFEVLDATNGSFVLRRQGTDPRFSPSGRFLTLETSVKGTFEAIDLLSRRVIGRYEAIRLHWSHGDSFLWYEDEAASKMQIVRALHGRRYELAEHPPTRREAKSMKFRAGLLSTMEEEPSLRRPRPPTLDIEPEGTTCARGCYANELWAVELSLDHGLVSFFDLYHRDTAPQILVYDLGAGQSNLLFANTEKDRRAYQEKLAVAFPKFEGWNIGDTLQTAAISYPTEEEKLLLAKTQYELSAATARLEARGRAPRTGSGHNRISRDPNDPGTAAASEIIGAQLSHSPTVFPAALRAGRDDEALRRIEHELATLYSRKSALFATEEGKNDYYTDPFPDPNEAPREEPVKLNLLAPGRDLWRWSDKASTYWLTQGVSSDHLSHTFSLSLVSRHRSGKLRHANLVRAANDPDGTFVYESQGADIDRWELRLGYGNLVPNGPFDLFAVGDARTHLNEAFSDASVVAISNSRYLIVLTKPVPHLFVFDLESWRLVCGIAYPIDGAAAIAASMHSSGHHVTQVNSTGAVHVYACPSGEHVLDGAYVDDELVIMDMNGYFDGSEDVAGYVHVAVPGLPGRHLLSQFAGVLQRPGLADDVLAGRKLPMPEISPPPAIRVASVEEPHKFHLEAFSSSGLEEIRFYADGVLYRRIGVSGPTARATIAGSDLKRAGNLTAFAVDKAGIVSAPLAVGPAKRISRRKAGRLLALAVGVDIYPHVPPMCGDGRDKSCNLKFAASDARKVARTVAKSPRYSRVTTNVLTNERATSQSILSDLDALSSRAGAADTLLVSFAAHGLLDSRKRLYIALPTTRLDDIDATSLSFEQIAARLRKSKARVIVLLDVCHAGMAGRESTATNDAAVSSLVTDSGASMIIFAASKGRQESEETAEADGGLFTTAFETVVARERKRHDSNYDGAISVNELYRGLKAAVVRGSRGQQTPWLSRNLLAGDFDLF